MFTRAKTIIAGAALLSCAAVSAATPATTAPDQDKEAKDFFAAGYQAEWIAQTQSVSVEQEYDDGDEYFDVAPGDTVEVSVTLRNTGEHTWLASHHPDANEGNEFTVATFKDPHVTSAPAGLGYDDPQHVDVGKSYFADESTWVSDYRVGTLTEDSVAPGETGTLNMTFRIPKDAPAGRYREDISAASGAYWLYNPTNGDPHQVMHIWVGFDVYRQQESSFFDNHAYIFPHNIAIGSSEHDVYLDGERINTHVAEGSSTRGFRVSAGSSHTFSTDSTMQQHKETQLLNEGMYYYIIGGADGNRKSALYPISFDQPETGSYSMRVITMLPDDFPYEYALLNDKQQPLIEKLSSSDMQTVSNISFSAPELLLSFGHDYEHLLLDDLALAADSYQTLLLYGDDEYIYWLSYSNRDYTSRDPFIVTTSDLSTDHDKVDIYADGLLMYNDVALGQAVSIQPPPTTEVKIFPNTCAPTKCAAIAVFRSPFIK